MRQNYKLKPERCGESQDRPLYAKHLDTAMQAPLPFAVFFPLPFVFLRGEGGPTIANMDAAYRARGQTTDATYGTSTSDGCLLSACLSMRSVGGSATHCHGRCYFQFNPAQRGNEAAKPVRKTILVPLT